MVTREQLQSFCRDYEHSKWNLMTPTAVGEWTAATDTIWALFVPRQPEWEDPSEKPGPPFDKIGFPQAFETGDWKPWSETVKDIPPIKMQKCDNCGSGKCECPQCEVIHDCGYCKGTNQIEDNVRYSILGEDFDNRTILKFVPLNPTECRLYVVAAVDGKTGKKKEKALYALLIRGDGWRGTVMSMSPKDDSEK